MLTFSTFSRRDGVTEVKNGVQRCLDNHQRLAITVNRTFDTIDSMEAPSGGSGPSALSRMLESDGNFADKMSLEERDGEEEGLGGVGDKR